MGRILMEIVDQLTDDETTDVLLWLARENPLQLAEAFQNGSARILALYNNSVA